MASLPYVDHELSTEGYFLKFQVMLGIEELNYSAEGKTAKHFHYSVWRIDECRSIV